MGRSNWSWWLGARPSGIEGKATRASDGRFERLLAVHVSWQSSGVRRLRGRAYGWVNTGCLIARWSWWCEPAAR